MAKKTIKCRLSVSDMLRLSKEIDGLKKELDRKCREFCQRLAERNMEVTKAMIADIPAEHKEGGLQVEVTEIEGNDGKYRATVRMSGSQCAFVEFGAGIILNGSAGTSPHPKGEELGYTIDSFNPNSKHPKDGSYTSNATNPAGWTKPGGEHTDGTPAYAPLYTGFMDMQADIERIAREVFGK